MNELRQVERNVKQLRISGLRGFSSCTSVFLGGYTRAPKTQPFHIAETLLKILKED